MYIDRIVQKSIINVTHFGFGHNNRFAPVDDLKPAPKAAKIDKTVYESAGEIKITRSFIFIVQNNNDLLFIGRFISPDATEESSSSIKSSTSGTSDSGYTYGGSSSSSSATPHQNKKYKYKSSTYVQPSFNLKPVSIKKKGFFSGFHFF